MCRNELDQETNDYLGSVRNISCDVLSEKKIIQLTSARQVQLADTFWDRLDAILTIEHAMVNAAPDTQRPLFAQSGP